MVRPRVSYSEEASDAFHPGLIKTWRAGPLLIRSFLDFSGRRRQGPSIISGVVVLFLTILLSCQRFIFWKENPE